MADTIVEVDRVSVDLGFGPIIDNVSFGVRAGQICRIVGEVGSGKTTLLRLLAGDIGPTVGSVERSVAPWYGSMAAAELPQDQTIAQIADERGIGTAVVRALTLGVAEHDLDRPIGELSFGNRQKAAVALSLAGRHELVLYDEPFAGVDQVSLGPMVEMFNHAAATGVAIVIANSVEVSGLADDVIVEL